MQRNTLRAGLTAALVLIPAVAFAQAPANDNIADATNIGTYPYSESVYTVFATPEATDGDCAGNGATVWYTYTPAADGQFEINTIGSDYDTTLSLYSGVPGGLSQIGCNDDWYGLQSRLLVDGLAGETYYIMVGSYASGPGGNLELFLGDPLPEPPPPPPPEPLNFALSVNSGTVVASTGAVTVSGTATCSRSAWAWVNGVVKQARGRDAIIGWFGTFTPCDGTVAWTAQVWSDNRLFNGRSAALFTAGRAGYEAFGQAQTFDNFADAFVMGTVNLRGTRR